MKGSTLSRALFATVLLPTFAQPQLLRANPLSPPSGSYELTARLELPHLERWGVDETTIICLSSSRGPEEIPVPVVSANNPFAKCSAMGAKNMTMTEVQHARRIGECSPAKLGSASQF
jgi:hypothetical protein